MYRYHQAHLGTRLEGNNLTKFIDLQATLPRFRGSAPAKSEFGRLAVVRRVPGLLRAVAVRRRRFGMKSFAIFLILVAAVTGLLY
ncbi:MAG TPA: hypothetical protein VF753_03340, partial [Terriglobales bacterium]